MNATPWLGVGVVVPVVPLSLPLPVALVGKYRDPSALDPEAGGTPFPFTARIEGGHEVVTTAGRDINNGFSTLTSLRFLEVFGAVLVDLLVVPGPFSPALVAPNTPVGTPGAIASVIDERPAAPASVWVEA